MEEINTLYTTCTELFRSYPLAIDDCDSDVSSMVLLLRDGDCVSFFSLWQISSESPPFFILRSWHADERTRIDADDGEIFSDATIKIITCGVPIPRHGSMFGWKRSGAVTAMIVFYSDYDPAFPLPTWAVMPRAGTPEERWPPFTGEPFLDRWFWNYYREGSVVSLDNLIAETPETVFWVGTAAALGWDSCAVTHNCESIDGYSLLKGCYVYYRALRMSGPIPPLEMLLSADSPKTDLALQFQNCAGGPG
jgi:hypothetical protein